MSPPMFIKRALPRKTKPRTGKKSKRGNKAGGGVGEEAKGGGGGGGVFGKSTAGRVKPRGHREGAS